MIDLNTLTFNAHGRIPCILQASGGEVLRLMILDRAGLEQELADDKLREARPNQNRDAVILVIEVDAASKSDFGGEPLAQPWLEQLETLLKSRKAGASLEGSYTQKLFAKGVDRIAKKVVEEAGEVVIAAKNFEIDASEQNREEYLGEAADLLFHLQVLLIHHGLGLEDIAKVLQERHRQRT